MSSEKQEPGMGAGLWSRARRGKPIPAWVGPTALLVISGFFVGVVVWGWLNPTDIRVEYYDAGPADAFEIGHVTAFPELNLYVIGLEDGRLRAIDGRIDGTDCTATWLPADERGRSHNPGNAPGVFEDQCTNTIWSIEGNAIEGVMEPLRTPYIDYRPGADGALHAFIERINP